MVWGNWRQLPGDRASQVMWLWVVWLPALATAGVTGQSSTVIRPLSVCMFSLSLYLGQPVNILLLRVYRP